MDSPISGMVRQLLNSAKPPKQRPRAGYGPSGPRRSAALRALIVRRLNAGESAPKLGKEYGLHPETIYAWRRAWRNNQTGVKND